MQAARQPLLRALPLTAAIDAMRGNMREVMRMSPIIAPVGILLVWLAGPFAVAVKIFRWSEQPNDDLAQRQSAWETHRAERR